MQLAKGLHQAEQLLERKQWEAAYKELVTLNQRFPNRPDVLTLLVNLAYDQQDLHSYQQWAEQLVTLTPTDSDITLGLAGAYLSNGRPALALRTFRYVLQRWPDHERAVQARQTAAELEANLLANLPEYGLSGADMLDLAALHEEMVIAGERGQFEQVRSLGAQLRRQCPQFVAPINNISQAYFAEGQMERAIATAREALDIEPQNHHALGNLTRYLCLSGHLEEAREWVERLKHVDSDSYDVWLKQAEALSYLGDDQGVLNAFQAAQQAHMPKPMHLDPLLYHLAAVATMRLGNEAEARKLWQQALKHAPWLTVARQNLDDLRKPGHERHAPWSFGLADWIAPDRLKRLMTTWQRMSKSKAATNTIQRVLDEYPEIVALIPLLLDSGDPQGHEFALEIAIAANMPTLHPVLTEFALGQHGPDTLRTRAANALTEANALPTGSIRMWQQGEWRDVLLLNFEISGEPMHSHKPSVEKFAREATQALYDKDAETAVQLIQQGLKIDPHDPGMLNNLAVAYGMQGKTEEAEALVREIHQRFPDYFFARVSVARMHLRDGEIETARELIKPLMERKRYHTSEFSQMCDVQVELWLADNNPDAARTWLDLWSQTDPDNPRIMYWRMQMQGPQLLQRLLGGLKGRKRKE